MIDEIEKEAMLHPIEHQERHLELVGPVWKAPTVREILSRLPFMRGQSLDVAEFFIRYGQMIMADMDSLLSEEGDVYVVVSGIVKVRCCRIAAAIFHCCSCKCSVCLLIMHAYCYYLYLLTALWSIA